MKSKTRKTTAALTSLAIELPDLIAQVQADIDCIAQRMDALKKAGLIYASPHWRKDASGVERYLYLLHPHTAGEKRRRDYVGCEAVRIAEAMAGIERAKEYDDLGRQLSAHQTCIAYAQDGLLNAKRYLIRPTPSRG